MAPRIGRQVEHSRFVDQNSITADFSEDMVFRYTLKMDFIENGNRDKTVAVVLKNPSSADEKKADNTIRRVEEYVYCNFSDVKTIYILNLFAIRATDAKDVAKLCKDKSLSYINGPKNGQFHKQIISRADYIITAWGGNSTIAKECYNQRIMKEMEIIKSNKKDNVEVFRVNSNKGSSFYPFHACFWSNKFDLIKENK